MRIVLEQYYTDLEQRCLSETCDFRNAYHQEAFKVCPRCWGRLGFFRAFGTEAQRSRQVYEHEGHLIN